MIEKVNREDIKMKKILIVVPLIILSSFAYAENHNEEAVMKKCVGLDHWSMIRCVDLESQGKDGKPLIMPAEQYQPLVDMAKYNNPIPVSEKSLEQGKTVFYQYCYSCHGMEGKGNGPGAEFTGKPVADLTSSKVREQKDGVLFWKITEGNIPRPMPMYRVFLKKEDIWNVINYMRSLSVEKNRK